MNDLLIEDNINLIHYVLRSMYILPENDKYDDFYGAGILGLTKAAKTYKKSKGSFSNHSYFLIKKEIQKCLYEIGDPAISYKSCATFNKKQSTLSLDFDDKFSFWAGADDNVIQKERRTILRSFIKDLGKGTEDEFIYWLFGRKHIDQYTKEERKIIDGFILKLKPKTNKVYKDKHQNYELARSAFRREFRRRAKLLLNNPEYLEALI